jgi:hypothetical protein
MAANNLAIYSRVGAIGWVSTGTAANTATDGTGTVATIFTADATNGGRVERLRFRAKGANVATVCRIFINNGLTNATAANNTLYAEITLPITALSQVAASLLQEFPQIGGADQTAFPLVLPPGYTLTCTLGTAVATGYSVTACGGAY